MKAALATVLLAGVAVGLAACNETRAPAPSVARAASTPESVCLQAVAAESGVSGGQTVSVTPSDAGTSVFVQVPGRTAPWNCIVDPDGVTVANVYYTGTDG